MEWIEADIDFSGAPAVGYEEMADPALFPAHGIASKPMGENTYEIYAVNHGGRESVEVFELTVKEDVPSIV